MDHSAGEITTEHLNKLVVDRKLLSLVKTTTRYLKSNPKAYPLMVYQASVSESRSIKKSGIKCSGRF